MGNQIWLSFIFLLLIVNIVGSENCIIFIFFYFFFFKLIKEKNKNFFLFLTLFRIIFIITIIAICFIDNKIFYIFHSKNRLQISLYLLLNDSILLHLLFLLNLFTLAANTTNHTSQHPVLILSDIDNILRLGAVQPDFCLLVEIHFSRCCE